MKAKLPRLTAEHILYGIAIANALRLAYAYSSADAGGNVFSIPGAFGLMLGAVVSVGTAFVSGKLGSRLTKSRKALSWTIFVILLVLEPMILAPITMTHLSPSMSSLMGPWFSWVWAVTLALVPSLVLAGVAIANGGLIEATAPSLQSDAPASTSAAGAGKSVGRAKSSSKNATESDANMRMCDVSECGISYRWPQGKGAHFKKHHPELVIRKGIPAQVSLPIKNDAKVER